MKRVVLMTVVIALLLCPIAATAAVADTDITMLFNSYSNLSYTYFDVGGRGSEGVLSELGNTGFGYSFRARYDNVLLDSNPAAALFKYSNEKLEYGTIENTYHYVVQFDVSYRMRKSDGSSVQSGEPFDFVLYTNSDNAPQTGAVGAWSVSNRIRPSSREILGGGLERLRYDFDFLPSRDYPGFVGKMQVDGWGLYLPGQANTLYSRVQLEVYNFRVTAYSSDEWQTLKIEQGFDNVDSEVVEGMKEYSEWEKEQFQADSNSAVQEATEAIKDEHSSGLLSAINNLMGVMSYNGTDASWTFPSITLPEIEGVMEETKLNDEQSIDFSAWVEKFPERPLKIVRALGTVALVLFSFKELWEVVEYCISLNNKRSSGGGTNE